MRRLLSLVVVTVLGACAHVAATPSSTTTPSGTESIGTNEESTTESEVASHDDDSTPSPVADEIRGVLERGDEFVPAVPYERATTHRETIATYRDSHRITVVEGWVVHVYVTSDAFDPVIELYDSRGTNVATNDDTLTDDGIGPDAELGYEVERSGEMVVVVLSDDDLGTGPYRVSIEAGPDVPLVETEDDTFEDDM